MIEHDWSIDERRAQCIRCGVSLPTDLPCPHARKTHSEQLRAGLGYLRNITSKGKRADYWQCQDCGKEGPMRALLQMVCDAPEEKS